MKSVYKRLINIVFLLPLLLTSQVECEVYGHDHSEDVNLTRQSSYDIALHIWIIRRDDGYTSLNENLMLEQIDNFNEATYAVDLCYTIDYIDNTDFYFMYWDKASEIQEQYYDTNAINMYLSYLVYNSVGSTVCGYAYYPNSYNRSLYISNSCAAKSTTPHELGHSFGNPHTHNNSNELVNGDGCEWRGDSFCDTPADPRLSGKVDVGCNYIGNDLDANGDEYDPDTFNYMSYSLKSCRIRFSQEQQDDHLTAAAYYAQTIGCETLGDKKVDFIKISPNPFKNVINLDKYRSYEIYDFNGRLLLKGESNKIVTDKIKDGIYLLKLDGVSIKVLKVK